MYIGNSGSATEVTASAAKLNLIKDSVAGSVVNNAAVIYGSNGEVNVSELQIGGTSVTANAGEINILDGVTNVTSSNINHLSGVESSVKDDLLARYTRYKQMINLVKRRQFFACKCWISCSRFNNKYFW